MQKKNKKNSTSSQKNIKYPYIRIYGAIFTHEWSASKNESFLCFFRKNKNLQSQTTYFYFYCSKPASTRNLNVSFPFFDVETP